jgi:PAS domain S-box-containing protein
MKMPIFFKIVTLSLFFSLLSLALYITAFTFHNTLTISYILYIFIIILGISLFAAGSIVEPLERLKKGFESIVEGKPEKVDIKTGDEFEDLANSFNIMAEELVKQREMLKKSEEKYRSLVEDINDWVFEVDKNLNFIYSSPKVGEILGYRAEEIADKNILDFVREDKSRILDEFERMKMRQLSFECEFTRKDGKAVYIEVSGRPFYENGGLRGFRCVGRDVTVRKKAEKEMAYFLGVLEHSVDAIVILDLDSRIISWNKGAEMMFGYTSEEVTGKPLNVLLPQDHWEQCRENFRRAVIEGHVRDIETVRITKDGRTVIVDQTLTSIHDSKGELIGFVAIMRDITKKKEAENELKKACEELERKTSELLESQKELRYLANIVENSNDAIYSVNLDGVITSWNKTAEKVFGWSKEEAIGMRADKLLPEEIKMELEFTLRRIKENAEFMRFETKRLRKNGEIVDVEVTISPIVDENGTPTGFSIISRDISWKLKAEREIMRKMLKYEVEKGRIYLVEGDFSLALDVFRDLVRCGFSGTIISRKYPEEIEVENSKYLWISDKRNGDTISASVSEVYDTIVNLPEWNNVVLLDLDYLLIRNNFSEIYEFIQKIKDVFYVLNKGIVIITLDPALVEERDLRLIRKECSRVRSKGISLPDEMYEVLRYVYMRNRVGEKPSIKDVMASFSITRNTAKKRINYLANRGLLNIIKNGRLRLLEVTERGKEIFA